MIDSLIAASLKVGDVSYLERLPRFMISKLEADAIAWVVGYTRKFHHPPTVERYAKSEHGIVYSTYLTTSPIEDLFEQTMLIIKQDYAVAKSRELFTRLSDGDEVTPTEIIEFGRSLTEADAELSMVSYMDLDRESMYGPALPEGVSFQIEAIDRVTGGLINGEFGLLVARTGVGKTTLTCKFAVEWMRLGLKVMFISCEMPPYAISARIDAMIGKFNPRLLRTKYDLDLLAAQKDNVRRMLRHIKDTGGDISFPHGRRITPAGLVGFIRRYQPDVVVVDGVYLMRTNDGNTAADWQRIKAISNELKQVAMEENVPIFGTSQIKRVGKDDDFTLEDVAFSDSLVQDTDLVMVAIKGVMSNEVGLQLLKNRNGESLGAVGLKIDWNTMNVEEVKWTRGEESDRD